MTTTISVAVTAAVGSAGPAAGPYAAAAAAALRHLRHQEVCAAPGSDACRSFRRETCSPRHTAGSRGISGVAETLRRGR